jgi:predicted metalloprotease with PDZ domain
MKQTVRILLLAAGLAPLTTTLPGGVPCCELRYTLEPDPSTGAIDVTLTVHGYRGEALVLERPSPRPLVGLLTQDPEIEGVRHARWDLADGAPRWTYDRPARGWDDPIQITYRLPITAERPLNAWSVGLDRDLLYAPAEALFLLPVMPSQTAQHAPVRVEWRLPSEWRLVTGWPGGSSFYGTRTLVKTDILAGAIGVSEIDACGIAIELGIAGEWGFAPEDVAQDIGAIACAARRRLGAPPVSRLAVMMAPARFPVTSGNRNGPRAVGFIHWNDGGPPTARLLAHEIVHLWQQFDAPAWFQEGVNDYLALRIAHEAGLVRDEALGEQLAEIHRAYRDNPHRQRWTFAEEQLAAKPFGTSDGYLAYRKGALVGLGLDRELRLRTNGRVDLAALWREMNGRTSWGHVRWTDDEIARRAAALVDGSMESFFGGYVEGTEEVPRPGILLADLPPLPPPAADRGRLGTVAAFLQATFD